MQARYLIGAGLGLTGLGLLLMGGIDASDDWTGLLPGFILAGAGVGLINPAIADVAVSVVPKEHSGMASGINDTFRQVGIAVGIAAWGAIFLGRGASQRRGAARGHAGGDGRTVRASWSRPSRPASSTPRSRRRLPRARPDIADAAHQGFLVGINDILMLGGILAIAGAVVAAVADPRAGHRARAGVRGRARVRAGARRARGRAGSRIAAGFSVFVTYPD